MSKLTTKTKKLVRTMLSSIDTDAGTIENTLNLPIPHWEGKYWDDTPTNPFESPVGELGEGKYFYTVPGNEERLVLYYNGAKGNVYNIGTETSPIARVILLLQEQDYETLNKTAASLANDVFFPFGAKVTFGRSPKDLPSMIMEIGGEKSVAVIEDIDPIDGGAILIANFGGAYKKITFTMTEV